MSEFPTIEDIVNDVISKLSDEDKQYLSGEKKFDGEMAPMLFALAKGNLLRWIRNSYGFWIDHPLTARWVLKGPNDIRDGVDYSTDHPDNVSGRIYDMILKRLDSACPEGA